MGVTRAADHGFTAPLSTKGIRRADGLALDAIEDWLGFACVYADCAREHARISDLRGLEYDLKLLRGHVVAVMQTFREIQDRHDAARLQGVQAQKDATQLEAEFA